MTGSVIPPIYATSTYKQDGVGGLRGGYEYSRSANPTRTALEGNIAALEEGERGFAFASGLAAEDTLVRGLLDPGDHVVLPDDAYGGTYRLFDKVEQRWGLEHTPGRALRPRRRARPRSGPAGPRWSGSRRRPTRCSASPTSRRSPRSPTTPARCSSSTTPSRTPYLQRPLTLGADVVVHSTTKYAGGHSDVVGGAVVVRDLDLAEKIGYHQNAMGAVAGPFDAWLVLRGLKTLAVRMDRHCDNAERVVEFLIGHPAVDAGLLPGLPDHPGTRSRPGR